MYITLESVQCQKCCLKEFSCNKFRPKHLTTSHVLPVSRIKEFGESPFRTLKVKDIPVTGRGGPYVLREVEVPTLLRQTANIWRHGCHPYAPAALYPQDSFFLRFLTLISVRGRVDPTAIVRSEGLGKFEKIHLIGARSRDLPACSVVLQPLRYRVPPPFRTLRGKNKYCGILGTL
jgi:hypothetical protein